MNGGFHPRLRKRPTRPQKPLASFDTDRQCWGMGNIIAWAIGIVSAVIAIPSVLPIVGWLLALILLPLPLIGIVIGTFSRRKSGRNFCILVFVLCFLRLLITF
ncbi:MAG: hypothetical protein CMN74_06550 [Sphingorhabdus sp.]|nr:hypothetical protein [Sphingorhabdus sp.]